MFPQQQHFATGSLAQISSGAIRCSFNTRFRARFWRVQKVTEGFVADTKVIYRLWKVLVRFWTVPVESLGEVVEGSGTDIEVRFPKVPVQILRSGSQRFRCRY